MKSKSPFQTRNRIWLIAMLSYISIINLFFIRTSAEIMALEFVIVIFAFQKANLSKYSRHWIPFIGFFFLYEFLRGYADNLSPFYKTTLFWIYYAEKFLFREIPTAFLQKHLLENRIIVDISLLFYSTFYYFSFFSAFVIWLIDTKKFEKYAGAFLAMSFVGLIFFFLIPTAPPWFVNDYINLGIQRAIYNDTILKKIAGTSIFYYFILGNAVAALPSLHVAWTAFTAIFINHEFKNTWIKFLYTVPLLISFSVVLSGEHFVLDILAGWLLAYLMIFSPLEKLGTIFNKLFFSKTPIKKNPTIK